jgi:hypothetical protein
MVYVVLDWQAAGDGGGGVRGSSDGRAQELVEPLTLRLGSRRRAAEVAYLYFVEDAGREPRGPSGEGAEWYIDLLEHETP